MKKVYSVKPGSNDIRVSDGRTITPDGPVTWGEKLKSIEMARLCRFIIADVIADERAAMALAHRFKWRVTMTWDKDKPHAITEDEVKAVIAQIREVERENAPFIDKMAREKPNYVTDRPAPGQVFTQNPEIVPNKPKEKSGG